MGLCSTSSRYGTVARTFHWLTVVLVLTVYLLSKRDPYSLYSAAADGRQQLDRHSPPLEIFPIPACKWDQMYGNLPAGCRKAYTSREGNIWI